MYTGIDKLARTSICQVGKLTPLPLLTTYVSPKLSARLTLSAVSTEAQITSIWVAFLQLSLMTLA